MLTSEALHELSLEYDKPFNDLDEERIDSLLARLHSDTLDCGEVREDLARALLELRRIHRVWAQVNRGSR